MFGLDADGVSLGYTEVSDLGDTITIPTTTLRGLIANMAVEVAPEYNGVVSSTLAQAALEGMKTMRLVGSIVVATELPSTLPIGSGNEGDCGGTFNHHFYPDLEAEILAETTGAIGLEENTNEVAS